MCSVGLALLRVIVTPFGQSRKEKRNCLEVSHGVMPTSCVCNLPAFLSVLSRITEGILGLGEDFGLFLRIPHVHDPQESDESGTSEGNVCSFRVCVCIELLRKCEQGQFISDLFLCPC